MYNENYSLKTDLYLSLTFFSVKNDSPPPPPPPPPLVFLTQILENDETIDHPQADPDGLTLDSDPPTDKKTKCC